jgi:hypothetical protein
MCLERISNFLNIQGVICIHKWFLGGKVESFLETCSGACSKYIKKSNHWYINHRDVKIHQCIHYWGSQLQVVKIPKCIYHWESGLPGVFITKESFWMRRSHITDFQEHTTIFKGSVILNTNCRFLMFEKLPNLVILIDSPVYSSPGNQLWIQITPWIFLKSEIVSGQNASGRQDSPVMNTLGSLDSWTVCH